MNARICLRIARRMDALLAHEIGTGVQVHRMLTDALYARDVLLVCDAHEGHELALLGLAYRRAAAAPAEPASAATGAGNGRRATAPAPWAQRAAHWLAPARWLGAAASTTR